MTVIFLLQAEVNIQSAFARYEEFQEDRGAVFMRFLDIALSLLRNQPWIGPHYEGPYRRLLISKFPYGIFYEVQNDRIVVAAVLDLRQDPKTIHSRLFGE